MKNNFKMNLLILLIFIQQITFAITFTTTQAGGNSFNDIIVEAGKQYQLKFELFHQTTNNVRIQILEGTSVLVDESNLMDGFLFYVFTPSSTVVTLKFIREDSDNISRDFKVENLVYEEFSLGTIPLVSNHTVGQKEYEITDHLGNLRVVFSDRRMNDRLVVLNASDYLPFGMLARSYSSGVGARYGFNGKENIVECGLQDYGFRDYNPLIGRFISVDPLTSKFPHYTPYQFAGNQPIWAIDLDGLEEYVVNNYYNKNGVLQKTTITVYTENDVKINLKYSTHNSTDNVRIVNHKIDAKGNKYTTIETTPTLTAKQQLAIDNVKNGTPAVGGLLADDGVTHSNAIRKQADINYINNGVFNGTPKGESGYQAVSNLFGTSAAENNFKKNGGDITNLENILIYTNSKEAYEYAHENKIIEKLQTQYGIKNVTLVMNKDAVNNTAGVKLDINKPIVGILFTGEKKKK